MRTSTRTRTRTRTRTKRIRLDHLADVLLVFLFSAFLQLLQPYAWIQKCIGQIHNEIHHDYRRRHKQHDISDYR